MSTLRTVNIQHPSATTNNITLNSNGTLGSASFANYPGRNRIVNGNFSIWQRGTSFSSAGGGVGSDCWRQYTDIGSGTQSRDTTGFTASDGTFIPSCYRFTVGGSATNFSLFQIIETSNCRDLAGQTVTLSAYLSSSSNITMNMAINFSTTTDNPWTNPWTGLIASSFSVTSTLTRFSTTVTIPSNMRTLQISFGPAANFAPAVSIAIANVQLELGSVATPFEVEDISNTLRKCQRYYTTIFSNNQSDFQRAVSRFSLTACSANYDLPVDMRIIPTIIATSNSPGVFGRIVGYDTNMNASVVNVSSIVTGTTENSRSVTLFFNHASLPGSFIFASYDTLSAITTVAASAEL